MSETITRAIMAKRIAFETEEPILAVRVILQAVLDRIVDDLANGRRIELRGFGVFETKESKGRIFHHFGRGEHTEIPSRTVVKFKPGIEMKKRVEGALKV